MRSIYKEQNAIATFYKETPFKAEKINATRRCQRSTIKIIWSNDIQLCERAIRTKAAESHYEEQLGRYSPLPSFLPLAKKTTAKLRKDYLKIEIRKYGRHSRTQELTSDSAF